MRALGLLGSQKEVRRAGATGQYGFGDDERQLGDYGWYLDNSLDRMHRPRRGTNPGRKQAGKPPRRRGPVLNRTPALPG